jgi:hypothetical protein
MFNTPDLLDQGVIASMRYPLNFDTKVVEVESGLVGADVVYLRSTARRAQGSWSYIIAETEGAPWFPSFVGLSTSLPSPNFTATVPFRNAANTFTVRVTDLLRYEVFGQNVRLINLSTTQFVIVAPFIGGQDGDVVEQNFRFYQTGSSVGGTVERAVDAEFSIIVLPPVSQDDMLQQNPKVTASLAKETGGDYLPGCIFQPIFNVTHSTSYRKIVLATKGLDLLDVSDPLVGWFDTFDTNFGVNVINMQGLPYACKPLVKLCRSIELVPASKSLLGAFATGAPVAQPEAIDVCKAFTDAQPHGYPSNYNGLGILFKRIFSVVSRIPRLLQTGRNLSREITEMCDQQFSSDEEEAPPPRRRTQARLRRVKA